MPFRKIEPHRVSTGVVQQIESLILKGVLHPGERLPSERDLAVRMDVSRPSVREALAELEENGLITTKPGAGAFVADVLGSAFSPPLVRLFSTHQEALFDYLSFRRDLEGMAAERAALHASDTDLEVVSTAFEKMEAAHSRRARQEEAELDVEFHMAIVEASHNVMMVHMFRSMLGLLKEGVFYNRAALFKVKNTRSALLEQHRAIHDAIVSRNPAGARKAAEAHLTFIEEEMQDLLRRHEHEETARLRLEHDKA